MALVMPQDPLPVSLVLTQQAQEHVVPGVVSTDAGEPLFFLLGCHRITSLPQ